MNAMESNDSSKKFGVIIPSLKTTLPSINTMYGIDVNDTSAQCFTRRLQLIFNQVPLRMLRKTAAADPGHIKNTSKLEELTCMSFMSGKIRRTPHPCETIHH